ncbi:ABC transporter B family member 3-like [Littorina saxatilis]|uniref:ABC transporter B family member 3-like n=1 Tax=Littorina saxatilis TaxID=31220 RepID=UPI0038B60DE5
MSAGALPLLCMVFVSFLAGSGVEADCSDGDRKSQIDCIDEKQAQLLDIFLNAKAMPCDEVFTTDRCSVVSDVVACLNGKDFQNDTCRANFDFTEVNPLFTLPCTLGEIYQACPDLPQLKGVNHTSSTSDANANNNNNNNNDDDDSSGGSDKMAKTNTRKNNENNDISGSRRQDVTYFLLMTSLMTKFVFGVHC